MRKIARVDVSAGIISNFFKHGIENLVRIDANPLPEDARLVGVEYCYSHTSFYFESESFQAVEDGCPIPILDMRLSRV